MVIGALAALSVLVASSAPGQTPTDATWGFVAARADSRYAHYVYSGYGYRAGFVVGALVDNPRSGYTEQIVGAGLRVPLHGEDTQFAVVAFSNASDGKYLQLYYLPSLTVGRVAAGATFESYTPIDAAGVWQFAITSLAVTTRVQGPLSAGLSYELSAAERSSTTTGVGAAVRLDVPHAELGVDAMRGLARAPSHIRLSFRSFY